jgi:hypothetical protein
MRYLSIAICAAALVVVLSMTIVRAQSPGFGFWVLSSNTTAQCQASTATLDSWCAAGGGKLNVMLAGQTTWTCIAGPGCTVVTGVQKVNSVAPGATGNVTISCPSTATTTPTAPPLSIAGGNLVVAAPAVPVVVTTNCTAVGS